jgi:hypothetical protein
MYVSMVQTSIKDFNVCVHLESSEPIRFGIGKYSEIGVHMTRDEALDLMSQLEKAIHKTAVEK